MNHLVEKKIGVKKLTKIVTANRPEKLEFLVNDQLNDLHSQGLEVVDVKYAINRGIGSALIIYNIKEDLL